MAYTTIDNPELYFQTKLWTGNGSTQSITLDGSENMQPDWVWIKDRGATEKHRLFDSVRGVGKNLVSNNNGAEIDAGTGTDGQLRTFDTDGFSLGSDGSVNRNTETLVGWSWKAGTSFSNDASSTGVGTIDSTGSISSDSGFSIISYTGTGSAGSVAHGLGVKPDWILSKDRSASGDWNVYHDSFANQERAKLNTTAAKTTNTSIYASLPTSSVINVGTGGNINTSGNSHIFYCFRSIQGYSKIGSYTGNGNADGIFVYTGFKPAFFLIKRTDAAYQWYIHDNKRNTFNVMDKELYPSTDGAEATVSTKDFLSNGVKIRGSQVSQNASGGTYIYVAFAESPFVNSKGIPTNAR